MTVITRLNAHGRFKCVCGDRAVIANSRFHPDSVLYLCQACAFALAQSLLEDTLTLAEAADGQSAP